MNDSGYRVSIHIFTRRRDGELSQILLSGTLSEFEWIFKDLLPTSIVVRMEKSEADTMIKGYIDVESTPGEGTTFTLVFPEFFSSQQSFGTLFRSISSTITLELFYDMV